MKWLGYEDKHNSWEPEKSFESPLLVKAFEESQSKKLNKTKVETAEANGCVIDNQNVKGKIQIDA